ncbi:MAG TPA: phosphate signaling complex protein PhoU [Beijerinckiaceae bacterium]|jgi:phosphate transport system protein|nr:phosphate signaling complex protein PhoU [Beijerinckiaceae bacterium]
MTDHTVKAYDADLSALHRSIAEMGGIAEKMLTDAMDALTGLNTELARKVVSSDMRLDTLQREIEEKAIGTIARRQPMAVDLRDIIAAIRVSGDLERVGDLAKNIAKRSIKIAAEPRLGRATIGLKHMGELAALQLKEVLDSYAEQDVEKARSVWLRDAEVDALEDSVFRDLLTFMMEDPRNISFCTHLLFCSKNIERVGDHSTNIAETVYYQVTGDTLPMERPKGASDLDDTAFRANPTAQALK